MTSVKSFGVGSGCNDIALGVGSGGSDDFCQVFWL